MRLRKPLPRNVHPSIERHELEPQAEPLKDPGDLLHMKRVAVHEMIDATPGCFAAREPDDRPRDVIRRRHVQQKIQVGNRPQFGIEPYKPPDQIRFVADSIHPIAGDAAQTIDRDRQAASLCPPGERVADPLALAVAARETLPRGEVGLLRHRPGLKLVDHRKGGNIMQPLWSSICGPIEQREDAVHIGGF